MATGKHCGPRIRHQSSPKAVPSLLRASRWRADTLSPRPALLAHPPCSCHCSGRGAGKCAGTCPLPTALLPSLARGAFRCQEATCSYFSTTEDKQAQAQGDPSARKPEGASRALLVLLPTDPLLVHDPTQWPDPPHPGTHTHEALPRSPNQPPLATEPGSSSGFWELLD